MHEMNESLTKQLRMCESCPRKCGVNRLQGHTGFCGMDASIRISHSGLHFGEEPPISGARGSGTIFFTGCNLRCVFCQNYQISQEYTKVRTRILTPDELASEMMRLQGLGARNINFVSPSHMIYQMADAIRGAREKGLKIPVVYNSNGYDSAAALRQIRGLVDVYLPDFKYMDNGPGKRFSSVDDYADVLPGVLNEMLDQAGHLETDAEGIAIRGVLVRHLILPGLLENSYQCLRFLADLSKNITISLMSQYSPRHRACDYPELCRTLKKSEYDAVMDYAMNLGLENIYIQECESQGHYLPDFTQENPFGVQSYDSGSSYPDFKGDE